MKIAYITPGSGDNFYCQNCFRDDELLTSMLILGHDVRKIQMYLPSGLNHSGVPGTPVFYGAVNLYLREKVPIYRHAPSWLERAFDSQAMLRYAAKKSGSTSASGLEGMTISMLHGEEGTSPTPCCWAWPAGPNRMSAPAWCAPCRTRTSGSTRWTRASRPSCGA